jgi:hypothetical protein
MRKQNAIIVDLDGTLCNIDHRQHHIKRGDWDAFYAGIPDDVPNEWCATILWLLFFSELDHRILIVSGRPEQYRILSMQWLEKQGIPYEDVFMRKARDNRHDEIVKEEIYHEHIEPHYNVLFVLDDRTRVVEMWRRLGLVCLQCAKGNF